MLSTAVNCSSGVRSTRPRRAPRAPAWCFLIGKVLIRFRADIMVSVMRRPFFLVRPVLAAGAGGGVTRPRGPGEHGLRARRGIAANGLSPAAGDEEAEQKEEKRAEEHEPSRVAERIIFSEDIQRGIVGNEPDRNHAQEEEAHPPLEDMEGEPGERR